MVDDRAPGLEDVREARERVAPYVHRTPVITCSTIDRLVGAKLFFKCENFQRTGAFKLRGATNAAFSLQPQQAKRGVVTHSSGNHGASLAYAASLRNIPATIVMPENAPAVKRAAVEGYGGRVELCRPTLEARESTAQRVVEDTGAEFIHPYNDDRIICGQATCAAELLQQVDDLEIVAAPVGGGGLLSGTILAVKHQHPEKIVIGCEPEIADDAFRSWHSGSIQPVERTDTVADGLRTALGDRTFPIIHRWVDEIALVSEDDILRATWLLLERAKIVVEPSAAVPLGAFLSRAVRAEFGGRRVGIILSGGNVDLRALRQL